MARVEILSLRSTGDSVWGALLLEGERLAHFRFAPGPVASDDEMRALIRARADCFAPSQSALEQFCALEEPTQRVVFLDALAAAA